MPLGVAMYSKCIEIVGNAWSFIANPVVKRVRKVTGLDVNAR